MHPNFNFLAKTRRIITFEKLVMTAKKKKTNLLGMLGNILVLPKQKNILSENEY